MGSFMDISSHLEGFDKEIPYPPYLFVIAMEGLNGILSKAVESRDFSFH